MKNVFIFLVFLAPLLCSGQTEFAPVGAEWHFSYDIDTEQPNQNYTNYKVVKDTLIEEQTCRKIEGTLHQKDSTIILKPLFVYNRNDSVFFFNNFLNRFTLLYDFSIAPGDTLVIPVPYLLEELSNDTIFREVIDSIVVKEFQGEELKYFYTRSLDNWSFSGSGGNGIYAEKIGNLNQPFLPSPFITLFFQPVRCYEDSNVSISFFEGACDFITSNEVVNKLQPFKIYPNPVSQHLFVEPIEMAGQITVFDAYGRLVKHFPVSNSYINVSDLPAGLYWISIEDKHKNTFYTYKIAKINN